LSWKLADIVPLLRPISLTPSISKFAEEFVVARHIGPTICVIPTLKNSGRFQKATDGTGAAVRVMLFDYRKAFDPVDHLPLADKITNLLPIPKAIIHWIIDEQKTASKII
jgi:hypothetical protein